MKLLGVIMAYNEADCIANAVRCLTLARHDVCVFDHGSTDGTRDALVGLGVRYEYLDREKWPNFTRPGEDNVHYRVTAFIRDYRSEYDWVSWIDADEILETADGRPVDEDIVDAHRQGYVGIRSELRNYWICADDEPGEHDYTRRIRRYEALGSDYCGGVNRCWRIAETPLMRDPILRHTFFGGKRIFPRSSVVRHYPIRNMEQGLRKIGAERQVWCGAGAHYAGIDAANIVRPSGWGLQGYNGKEWLLPSGEGA